MPRHLLALAYTGGVQATMRGGCMTLDAATASFNRSLLAPGGASCWRMSDGRRRRYRGVAMTVTTQHRVGAPAA